MFKTKFKLAIVYMNLQCDNLFNQKLRISMLIFKINLIKALILKNLA